MDLDQFAALARAAQGKRWVPTTRLTARPTTKKWPSARDLDRDGFGVWFGSPEDDAYIAAASPDVVLALVERVREAIAAAKRYGEHDATCSQMTGHGACDCGWNAMVGKLTTTDGTTWSVAADGGLTGSPDPDDNRAARIDGDDTADDEAAARWTAQPLGAARIDGGVGQ